MRGELAHLVEAGHGEIVPQRSPTCATFSSSLSPSLDCTPPKKMQYCTS